MEENKSTEVKNNRKDFMNKCLDGTDTKSDCLFETKGYITFQGWNIKDIEIRIKQELEEYFEKYLINLKIISKKEMAYCCCRYYDGCDAQDEGYSYWIYYKDVWKKGLGKATCYTIEYELSEVLNND